MEPEILSIRAEEYLRRLCQEIPNRRVGTAGNRAATDFVAGVFASFGFGVECPPFECIDWIQTEAELRVGGIGFSVRVSPFSLGGHFHAPLQVVTTVEELEGQSLAGQIALLKGPIASEQLMPKGFVFYNPEEHQRIVRALETAQPLAIVAATGRDPNMAGAVYPFPLIEDGDFDIPSVYTTDVEGERLASWAGSEATLEIGSQRIPATGCNVIARKGSDAARRAVLFAHVDAKEGTPGALDNAGGVSVLMLLAQLLADYSGELGIELVAVNGEDYYAASGEMQWLRLNEHMLQSIVLGINLDGVGHRGGRPAYSLYGCPPGLAGTIRQVLGAHPALAEGQPWYQGDHGLFLLNSIPALAFTSEQFNELWEEVAHTERDTPDLIAPSQLVAVAFALRDLLLYFDRHK